MAAVVLPAEDTGSADLRRGSCNKASTVPRFYRLTGKKSPGNRNFENLRNWENRKLRGFFNQTQKQTKKSYHSTKSVTQISDLV